LTRKQAAADFWYGATDKPWATLLDSYLTVPVAQEPSVGLAILARSISPKPTGLMVLLAELLSVIKGGCTASAACLASGWSPLLPIAVLDRMLIAVLERKSTSVQQKGEVRTALAIWSACHPTFGSTGPRDAHCFQSVPRALKRRWCAVSRGG
jgi:hypothetical protein